MHSPQFPGTVDGRCEFGDETPRAICKEYQGKGTGAIRPDRRERRPERVSVYCGSYCSALGVRFVDVK